MVEWFWLEMVPLRCGDRDTTRGMLCLSMKLICAVYVEWFFLRFFYRDLNCYEIACVWSRFIDIIWVVEVLKLGHDTDGGRVTYLYSSFSRKK